MSTCSHAANAHGGATSATSVPEAVATSAACLLAWTIEAVLAERQRSDSGPRTLLLCGVDVPAWRSAAQLGAAYAALGWNTVIVDARNRAGEARNAAAAPDVRAVPTDRPCLSVVLGQPSPLHVEPRRLREFLRPILELFERVLIAADAPQAAATVVPALAIDSDIAVIVVRPGQTRRAAAAAAVATLRDLGVPVAGIVLSDG